MSKILKTHCIFEYYTPENLWFMNFNNTPLIPSANHSPKYLLMETCDRFCFAFILAYSRICKGKHAHIRYMYMHTHTHETICYKTVLEELFQTTHWQHFKVQLSSWRKISMHKSSTEFNYNVQFWAIRSENRWESSFTFCCCDEALTKEGKERACFV